MKATALIQRNSLAYVEEIFAAAAARRTIVGVPDAARARALPGISVEGCIDPPTRHGWISQSHALIDAEQPAQILFTSGTEGEPKAIVLSHANQADAARRLIAAMEMTAEIREYVGVPVTYSFGMGRMRAIAAVGGQAYLSARGFDPLELAQMLSAGEVNALSAVPTLLRILLAAPEVIGDAGRRLRWLEIGSQYMSAEEKRGVRHMFPNARIVQHYGLTEASRSTFLDISRATDAALESVGHPTGNVEIGFDARSRIRIRGPHVARLRVDAQGLHPLLDAEGWLQTNDLGHLQDGNLVFDGRADDVINCGGVKLVPDLLEARIRARFTGAGQIAVARLPDAARGEVVLVASDGPESGLPELRAAAAQAMEESGVAAAGNLQVWRIDAMPLTATGKPRRRELGEQFASERQALPAAPAHAGAVTDVRSLFQRIFPGADVRPQDTFSSLGGDSLRYIQFSMEFERRFGVSPTRWEAMTVADLQKRADSAQRTVWRHLEPSAMLRAVAMMLIVARHAGTFVYSSRYGAGILLFALGGYALARFQLPDIIRKGSARGAVATALLIAIPTILVTVPLQWLMHAPDPIQLFMLGNLVDPEAPERAHGVNYYFTHVYFQLLVLSALLFSFPAVRTQFRDHPMRSALVLLGTALLMKLAFTSLWSTEHLFNRVPQYYGWFFCLGILVAVARSPRERLLALVITLVGSYFMFGLGSSSLLFAGGLALVLFVPYLPVPAIIKSVVEEVAAASIFIYLLHYEVLAVITKHFGPHPWLAFLAAAALGVIAAHLYDMATRWISGTSLGQRMVRGFRRLAGQGEVTPAG